MNGIIGLWCYNGYQVTYAQHFPFPLKPPTSHFVRPINAKRAMEIAGIYSLKRPIELLKLRVKVVQRKSPVELFGAEDESRDPNFLEAETRVFGWQERVFSPAEVNFYGDEKNCTAELEREYHRLVKENDVRGSSLYSYTQRDSYAIEKDLPAKAFRSYLSTKNSSALPIVRNRKPFKKRYDKRVVEDAIAEKRIRANHYFYTRRTTMYCMADLGRKGREECPNGARPNPDAETLLCRVTYDAANRILTIEPDFTGDDPYVITNDSGLTYDYWIEPVASNDVRNRRNDTQQRQFGNRRNIHSDLQLSPLNVLRVFLTIEIASINGFLQDGSFVRYFIDLPRRWTTNCVEDLSGRTQRSLVRNDVAYLSYVRDIMLDFDNSILSEDILPNWPCLLLAVSSLDQWTRYRTEGYASLQLPMYPGSYKYNVPTWRASGTIIDRLRRFFTGGGSFELKDITHQDIPYCLDTWTLNKANLSVVPSGSVQIHINVITQTRNTRRYLHSTPDNFKNLGTDTLINDVENVFKRFKAVRERMIQVREGIF